MSSDFKAGFVAIVGWPNVGKSTLLNSYLGTKLSIVTPKPQTTRDAILGILNEEGMQMIFLDTPGWLDPKEGLQTHMKRAILKSVYDDADLVVWLKEPGALSIEDKKLAAILGPIKKPLFVVINKIDTLANKNEILDQRKKELQGVLEGEFQFFGISARSKDGLKELKDSLKMALPISPAFYPTDQITDRWERYYVCELIREKIFDLYTQEIPHASCVLVEEFVEKSGHHDYVKAQVFVETPSQKQILIGKNGQAVKRLSQLSRQEIEHRLGRPIFLEIKVEVKKNWRRDQNFVKNLHADFS